MMVEGDDGPKSSEEVVDWFEKQRLQGSVDKRAWKQQTGAEVQTSANTQIGKCCCEGNIMEEVLTLFLRNQYK